MKEFDFKPKGVCSRNMHFEIEGQTIKKITVEDGCHGNLQGISALLKDMPVDFAIERLSGIRCHSKKTSCPDQIAKALKEYRDKEY